MHYFPKKYDESFVKRHKEKCEYFSEMLQQLRFKEYYTERVGVELVNDPENFSVQYLLVFIDTRFEEAVITRDNVERTRFFRSLGPEYDLIWRFIRDIRDEYLTGKEIIHINRDK